MQGLMIPVLLVVLAAGLLLMELVLFSGALAFVAAAVYIGGIVLAFQQAGPVVGMIFMLATMFGGGLLITLLIKWFPHTSMGRSMFNQPPDVSQIEASQQHLRSMIGQVGKTLCDMLPGGLVQIGTQRLDAVSEAGAIDKDMVVQVVAVRSQRLVVRPYHPSGPTISPPEPAQSTGAPDSAEPATGAVSDPGLAREFPDPFSDPLA